MTKKILIVEDNKDAADSMAELLEIMGYEARKAFNGSNAIAQTKEFSPDMILLDLGLPDMSGFAVAAQLQQLPQFNDCTLIALTGYGDATAMQETKAAGFHHHLVKPVQLQELETLLNSL